VSETQRTILIALYAAILGALHLPLPADTRRSLRGAACQIARDLGVQTPT
jgi:hypothetical protein